MGIINPIDPSAVTIQSLKMPHWAEQGVHLDMLRLDALHPYISGNKWYKLLHNLEQCHHQGLSNVLSFGGAFSNHLIALAAAAQANAIKAYGIVRGKDAENTLNPVLEQCKAMGMELIFWDRSEYSKKEEPECLARLAQQYPDTLIIPEGGANAAGREGAKAMAQFIPATYDYCIISVGTGTSLVGLRNALPETMFVLGLAPMKGGAYLKTTLAPYINKTNWDILDRFHMGGFGKANPDLLHYIDAFQAQQGISLDRVYTAKMMMGLEQLIAENYFPSGSKILCIHSGGLTGN